MNMDTHPVTVSPLTRERAARLLRDLAREKPNELAKCRYSDAEIDLGIPPTEPVCIVGHVLVRHGLPVENLDAAEGISAEDLPNSHPVFQFVTQEAAHLLQGAQVAQDGGDTWGNAVGWALDENITPDDDV